jgi:hypothetical protein
MSAFRRVIGNDAASGSKVSGTASLGGNEWEGADESYLPLLQVLHCSLILCHC